MPGGLVLRGERVTLRPLQMAELEAVFEGLKGAPGPWSPDRERLKVMIARSGRLVGGRLTFGIEAGGRLIGDVSARQPVSALPPDVFEVGIDLYGEGDRGLGYGSEAVALLTEHLFCEAGAERVQASTAEWNAPMRSVLEKVGFIEEGVMRGFMPRNGGGRDDYVLYARLRG